MAETNAQGQVRKLQAALAHLQAGRAEDAESVLRIVLALDPKNADALNLLGVALQTLGRAEHAIPYLAEAVALNPTSGMYRANYGAALALSSRGRDAAEQLEVAVELRPDNRLAARNLGVVLSGIHRGRGAIPTLRRAVELAPDAPEPRLALSHALLEDGQMHEAALSAAAVLELDPSPKQAEQAAFLREAASGQPPDRAPRIYVKELFDVYAPHFDEELEGKLHYRTPSLLADMLGKVEPAPRGVALDLGCGTGLSGLVLKPFATQLTGLDLSPKMLEQAGKRGVYDDLVEADILDHLPTLPAGGLSVVMAADVLNYLGNLVPVLAALAPALAPGGVFAFSLEKSEKGEAYALSPALRFTHDPVALIEAAAGLGYEVAVQAEAEMRMEAGKPVIGALLVLRKAA
mgnify:CR=1 FL=1